MTFGAERAIKRASEGPGGFLAEVKARRYEKEERETRPPTALGQPVISRLYALAHWFFQA